MLLLNKSSWKWVASACLTLSLLAACGKESKSKISQDNAVAPSSENSKQIKDSYQFVLNGCDTGKHEFIGDDSDSVKKQLCDALQDDKLNASCAESLRLEQFKVRCSGYKWSPRYEK